MLTQSWTEPNCRRYFEFDFDFNLANVIDDWLIVHWIYFTLQSAIRYIYYSSTGWKIDFTKGRRKSNVISAGYEINYFFGDCLQASRRGNGFYLGLKGMMCLAGGLSGAMPRGCGWRRSGLFLPSNLVKSLFSHHVSFLLSLCGWHTEECCGGGLSPGAGHFLGYRPDIRRGYYMAWGAWSGPENRKIKWCDGVPTPLPSEFKNRTVAKNQNVALTPLKSSEINFKNPSLSHFKYLLQTKAVKAYFSTMPITLSLTFFTKPIHIQFSPFIYTCNHE